MTTIEVLDPAGPQQKLAPLQLTAIGPLEGCRLAILDNGKPNFQRLATLLAEQVQSRHALGSIRHYRKEHAAIGAGAVLLDQIAREADLVLTGSAD